MPAALQTTLDVSEGFADVARLLRRSGTRRIVASGNGASYYVAQALWLATMEGERCPLEVVAVPGGLLAKGRFRWRKGDVLLAISSSGELLDVIEAIESPGFPHPFAAVTATSQSTIASGSVGTLPPATLLPLSSTSQMAVCSIETSKAAYFVMAVLLPALRR